MKFILYDMTVKFVRRIHAVIQERDELFTPVMCANVVTYNVWKRQCTNDTKWLKMNDAEGKRVRHRNRVWCYRVSSTNVVSYTDRRARQLLPVYRTTAAKQSGVYPSRYLAPPITRLSPHSRLVFCSVRRGSSASRIFI